MKIAVASGKGGTGKTTVATNLAYVASHTSQSVAYVDCDVEEPNGHIFLKPEFDNTIPVFTLVPKVDSNKCISCGKCGEICNSSAIVLAGKTTLVFADLCNGCGGCSLVCPTYAITEVKHQVGKVQAGSAKSIAFVHGYLDIGQTASPPVISAVKNTIPVTDITIIDAPPGTSCPVIESIRGCDFLLLVTEPTPFGLNDLKLAVAMARVLKLSFAVVINRQGIGDRKTHIYCQNNNIPILAEIPDDRKIAQVYSRGELVCEILPEYKSTFEALLKELCKRTRQ